MEKRPAHSKNIAAVAAIIVLFLAGHAMAPDESSETRMTCPGTQEVVLFDDIEACEVSPGVNFGCDCSRASNRWYYVVTIGFLPMIAGAIGHYLTSGPLRTRLLFMNAAVVAALFSQGLPMMLDGGPESARVVQLMPLLMIIHCIVVTIWFNLFGRVARARTVPVAI
jgi:Na+/H+ antiporter NhaC